VVVVERDRGPFHVCPDGPSGVMYPFLIKVDDAVALAVRPASRAMQPTALRVTGRGPTSSRDADAGASRHASRAPRSRCVVCERTSSFDLELFFDLTRQPLRRRDKVRRPRPRPSHTRDAREHAAPAAKISREGPRGVCSPSRHGYHARHRRAHHRQRQARAGVEPLGGQGAVFAEGEEPVDPHGGGGPSRPFRHGARVRFPARDAI